MSTNAPAQHLIWKQLVNTKDETSWTKEPLVDESLLRSHDERTGELEDPLAIPFNPETIKLESDSPLESEGRFLSTEVGVVKAEPLPAMNAVEYESGNPEFRETCFKVEYADETRTEGGDSSFKCHNCEKTFAQKSEVDSHMITHTVEEPYECDQCKRRFLWKQQLRRHMVQHTGEKPHECDMCQRAFAHKNDLTRHIFTHVVTQDTEKSYERGKHEKAILRDADSRDEEGQNCSQGGTESEDSGHGTCVPVTELDSIFEEVPIKLEVEEDGEGGHWPGVSEDSHTGKSVHDMHTDPSVSAATSDQEVSLPEQEERSQPVGSQWGPVRISHTRTRATIEEKGHKCHKCNEKFARRLDLRVHKANHGVKRHYKCDQCPQTFARKDHFNAHMCTHTGKNVFECDQCQQPFSRKYELTRHMLKHTGERPFKCDVCQKAYVLRSSLNRHMLFHTSSKPVEYDQRVKQESRMQRESESLDSMHDTCVSSTELFVEVPIKLEVKEGDDGHCPGVSEYSHTRKSGYDMRTGSGVSAATSDQKVCFPEQESTQALESQEGPVSKSHSSPRSGPSMLIRKERNDCHDCRKTFVRRYDFTLHMMSKHGVDRAFNCDKCQKTFFREEELAAHMLTHPGVKPLECDKCLNGFGSSSDANVVVPMEGIRCALCTL